MAHYQLNDDDAPRKRWTPRLRHEILAAAREEIRGLDADQNGLVSRAEVLAALTPEEP